MYSPETLWQKIAWRISQLIDAVDYFFAERWLNRTFGYQEYWGEYLDRVLPYKGGKQC